MLIRFALPTILSTIFMSIYSSVDGMFVARLVNTDVLSAVNIVMPMIFVSSGIGMMFGSGGNALVAKKLGERKEQESREDFSLLLLVAFVSSLVIVGVCAIFLKPLLHLLGADEALMAYCVPYMIPVLISMPFTIFGTIAKDTQDQYKADTCSVSRTDGYLLYLCAGYGKILCRKQSRLGRWCQS